MNTDLNRNFTTNTEDEIFILVYYSFNNGFCANWEIFCLGYHIETTSFKLVRKKPKTATNSIPHLKLVHSRSILKSLFIVVSHWTCPACMACSVQVLTRFTNRFFHSKNLPKTTLRYLEPSSQAYKPPVYNHSYSHCRDLALFRHHWWLTTMNITFFVFSFYAESERSCAGAFIWMCAEGGIQR